jgi:hypothetical protein
VQKTAAEELKMIPVETRRFLNPQAYCVGLEKTLYYLKLGLLQKIKNRLC